MAQIDETNLNDGAAPEVIFGSSALGVPIVLTAVRCTLLYILVPFVLPMFGIADSFSPAVNMTAGFLGVGLMFYNLTRLWNTSWRTRYLILSLLITPFILLSLYFDYLAYLKI